MAHGELATILSRLQATVPDHPGLVLLVLFGSRARGDAWQESDWDFAYIAEADLDRLALMASLAEVLATDRVDLVDLSRAGGLVRFRVARDGLLVHEAAPGAFDRFRFAAARFWYDAEPVLAGGYDEILRSLA